MRTPSLSDGTVIDQGDRAENRYGVTARVGYEVSPAIQPFVQAGAALRVRDQELDSNGNARGGTDFDLRGGIARLRPRPQNVRQRLRGFPDAHL